MYLAWLDDRTWFPDPKRSSSEGFVAVGGDLSVERLLRFLVALGQDVEIVVREHRGAKDEPSLRVA